jgi:hypothetical protein
MRQRRLFGGLCRSQRRGRRQKTRILPAAGLSCARTLPPPRHGKLCERPLPRRLRGSEWRRRRPEELLKKMPNNPAARALTVKIIDGLVNTARGKNAMKKQIQGRNNDHSP